MFNENKLRGRIVECGYTIPTLAKALGITPPSMRGKLVGKTQFTIREICKICELLGIGKDDFFDYFFVEVVHK